jgi:two-component system NtrC family sensor kinase
MSLSVRTTARSQAAERAHEGIERISSVGATALDVAMVVYFWGQWRVVASIVAIAVVMATTNLGPIEWLARRRGRSTAETARMFINALGVIVLGYVTGWIALSWAFVPYNLLWFLGLDDKGLPRTVTYLLLINVGAFATGATVGLALPFSLLGLFGFLLLEHRHKILRQVLQETTDQREQLEQAHQRLQQAHERAIEQEKLASLGMMAAGVAHEINNPMSYVTSNVNLLLKDLRQHQALPQDLLREYADDVLPATLDGIKRVNAIVADLRRFSRGDPENQVAYDLNAEARMALRIASGQLDHCQVDLDLGEVGTLLGRPRQIVQVLVNLLVNAGQATASGGKVCLSTRRVGDQVLMEVRDTGAGMSPDIMRNLFQPFFTTKPPGMGTGLGLAVVHGIVSAHGGRIEVESHSGQGSRFAVYLPCAMPSAVSAPPPLH